MAEPLETADIPNPTRLTGGQVGVTPAPAEAPGPLDAVYANWQTGSNATANLISAGIDAYHAAGMAPEPGFDPYDPRKYQLQGYELDARRFVGARSTAEANYIKGQIDEERQARELLARQGPVSGAVSSLVSAIGPELLLPAGSTVLKTAGRFGSVAGGESLIRQATHPDGDVTAIVRDAAEGGIFAGSLHGLNELGGWMTHRAPPAALESYVEATSKADAASFKPSVPPEMPRGVYTMDEGGNVVFDAAATAKLGTDYAERLERTGDPFGRSGRPMVREVEESPAEPLEGAGGPLSRPMVREVEESTVGAQQARGASFWGPDDNRLADAFGSEKIPTTWFMRSMNAASETVRDIAAGLADGGMFLRGNFRGLASDQAVESRVGANWNGRLHDVLAGSMSDYLEYRGAGGATETPLRDLAMQRMKDLVGGRGSAMTYGEFKAAITDALENGDRHYIPQVETAAKRIRAHVDELKAAADQVDLWAQPLLRQQRALEERMAGQMQPSAGLQTQLQEVKDQIDHLRQFGPNPGGSDTWFKRMWLHSEVRGRSAELEQRLDGYLRTSRPDLWNQGYRGADAVDAILARQPFRQAVEDVAPTKASQRQRGLDWIPNTLVTDFLERDSEVLTRAYHREMAVDIELSKRFGTWDMHDTLEAARVDGATPAQLEDLRTGRDFLRSTAGWSDPDSVLTQASHAAKMFANVTLLGGSTITALMDTARPVMTEGIARVFKDGLLPFYQGLEAFQQAGKDAINAGVGGEILLWMRTHGQAGLEPFAANGKVMQAAEKLHSGFFLANLIAPWTDMMKGWTTMIVSGRIRDAAAQLAGGGLLDAGDELRLLRSGIDDRMLRRIHVQFEAHGVDAGRPGGIGTTRLPNLAAWTDGGARDAMAAAIHSDVNRAIVTPGIADKATWMEKGIQRADGSTLLPASVAGVLSQYYSFAIASTQKMMISGLQQRDMAFVSGLLATVALAGVVTKIKDNLNAPEGRSARKRSLGDFLTEAVDRSGTLGYFGNLNNALERLSGNSLGLRPALGLEQPTNSVPYRLSGLGPTGSTVANLYRLANGAAHDRYGWNEQQALRKLLPLQNVFYLDSAFDKLQAAGI